MSDPRFIERYNDKIDDPNLKQYFANVTQIDEAVGEIVWVMKEEWVYDETLIWHTSDIPTKEVSAFQGLYPSLLDLGEMGFSQ